MIPSCSACRTTMSIAQANSSIGIWPVAIISKSSNLTVAVLKGRLDTLRCRYNRMKAGVLLMPLTELIVGAALLDGCESLEKTDVVQQLLERLAADGYPDRASVPSVPDGVMRRESLASTGIGRGIAVPHTKHAVISRRLDILGRCRPLVDFDSADAEPVDLIILPLTPPDSPGYQSMRVPRDVEDLTRRLRSAKFCERLRQSKTAEELWEINSQSGQER